MYSTARLNILGEEISPYQKVGNTAFVTLDEFTFSRIGNYEIDCAQPLGDTIAIISAVHQAIIADEEIENVVLDLSCNGGGAVDAAIYTIAWMLGYCDFSIVNNITNSKSTITYKADVNYDHEFDEADSISNKNLYCLISPVSFSCGNLVPALLKASGNVTIMGKTSTGGACVVSNAVTADGTIFNISSPGQLATVKNGTYYSIDIGVEPDVYLSNIESFYNRAELTAYINTLM
jgi:C-terminal processing protease CtpA/Prc